MNKNNLLNQTNKLIAQKRFLLIAVGFSLPLNLILAIALFFTVGTERIVLVPPTIKQSLWIENNQASTQVLEQWGDYFVSLLMNVTPETIETRANTLLSYVDSENYGAIKALIEKQSERLKRRGISTYFNSTKLQGIEKTQSVILHGNLKMVHGNSIYETIPKTFKLKLSLQNGKPFIKLFQEVLNNAE